MIGCDGKLGFERSMHHVRAIGAVGQTASLAAMSFFSALAFAFCSSISRITPMARMDPIINAGFGGGGGLWGFAA